MRPIPSEWVSGGNRRGRSHLLEQATSTKAKKDLSVPVCRQAGSTFYSFLSQWQGSRVREQGRERAKMFCLLNRLKVEDRR